MFATGVTVNLAEWIIDDTCLISKKYFSIWKTIFGGRQGHAKQRGRLLPTRPRPNRWSLFSHGVSVRPSQK